MRSESSIRAQALREAADYFESLPMNSDRDGIRSGTWEWFELFPIDHLRNRADQIEQEEAGREEAA